MTAFIQFFQMLCAASELLKALCANRMDYIPYKSVAQGSYICFPFLKHFSTELWLPVPRGPESLYLTKFSKSHLIKNLLESW